MKTFREQCDDLMDALRNAPPAPARELPGVKYSEFAKLIGVARSTVSRWVGEGLPSWGQGSRARIGPKAGQAWVKKNRANSVAIKRNSVVYFAQRDSDGAVKIGFTSDLTRRLDDLCKSAGCTVALLAMLPGNATDEFSVHYAFAEQRIEGEWFRLEGELAAFVAGLRGPGLRKTYVGHSSAPETKKSA